MITVVEPHPDDAFISLGATIERWISEHREVRIVTVYASPERAAESAAYAREVGARHVSLGLTPQGAGLNGGWEAVPLPSAVLDTVRTDPPGTWVFPVGIQHPEHRAVADLGWATEEGRRGWGYVDLPYALKVGQAEETRRLLASRTVVSWERPHAHKWRSVRTFKSQSLFFHRNLDLLRHAPEVVVGHPVQSRRQAGV